VVFDERRPASRCDLLREQCDSGVLERERLNFAHQRACEGEAIDQFSPVTDQRPLRFATRVRADAGEMQLACGIPSRRHLDPVPSDGVLQFVA
jgi:hypothetical protein